MCVSISTRTSSFMCDYYVEIGALYSTVLNRKNNNDFPATQNSEQFPDITFNTQHT